MEDFNIILVLELNNGLIRLGHNVISLSDRDLINFQNH